ncbi:MAG: DUF1587 domain-containing protein [Planctomycetaceae bacterium]
MKAVCRDLIVLSAFLMSSGQLSAEDVASLPLKRDGLQTFLSSSCEACHSKDSISGGLNLAAIGTDLVRDADRAVWVRVFDRVAAGEMPPRDADQPAAGERLRFLKDLKPQLEAGHAAQKGTVLRRLNRNEYQNTLNDLFGTQLNLAKLLPEDGRSHEFDNVGESLSVSMVQMQRYLEGIDSVMDVAIANTLEPPEVSTIHTSYAETSEGEKFIGSQWLKLDDGAVVFFVEAATPRAC